jgi:CRISPR system Cascade subunit CasC
MLIQIHILQNYAPSNLNRDDTGSPKDAIFGGFRRGRISSQCLKRSIRRSEVFAEAFSTDGLLGVRTRLLPVKIEEALKEIGADEPAIKAIFPHLSEIGRESSKGAEENDDAKEPQEETSANQTKQLIFIGQNELRPIAKELLSMYKEMGPEKWKKAKIAEITKRLGASVPKSVDIAMFGRMTTSEAFENVNAAVQVAHAISTNALSEEFDYFTAVDDLSGQSGAGMIGDVEFNSSTFYKYLNIHWEALVANLGGDLPVARQAVQALIQAAATAQPSGKQNTFAAYNLPALVLVEVFKRNLPVSYANAFLKPVRASNSTSLVEGSIAQLAGHMAKVTTAYNLEAERAFVTTDEVQLPGAVAVESLAHLTAWVSSQLPGEA